MSDICLSTMVGGGSVDLHISCKQCGNDFNSGIIAIPAPSFAGETAADSMVDDTFQCSCDVCHTEYNFNIWSSLYDLTIDSDDCDDFYADSIFDANEEDLFQEYLSQLPDQIFLEQLAVLKKISKIGVGPLEAPMVNKMIIVNGITLLECYLADTLRKQVSTDDGLKAFVKNYEEFKNDKISVSSIYDKIDGIRKDVDEEISKILFHNLSKVNGIFRSSFDWKVPLSKELFHWVNVRHDLVHRNGKKKNEDTEHLIEDAMVQDFISLLEKFVADMDSAKPKPQQGSELLDGLDI